MAKDYSSRNTTVVLDGFKPVDPSRPDKRAHDLTGRKFGKLTVEKYAGRRHVKDGSLIIWICRCECGKLTLAATGQLLTPGFEGSCGCSISAKNWKRKNVNIRHHPLYTTWSGIVRRTGDSLAYILRGMCEGFRELEHFAKVMGPKPGPEFSVDRIENNDGYWCGCCEECVRLGRKKNVRWATQDVQSNNKGNNNKITYAGKTMTISQWAKESGLPRKFIRGRFQRGWTAEQIFETAKLKNASTRKPIHHSEETQQQCAADYMSGATLPELAEKYDSERHVISKILKRLGVAKRTHGKSVSLGKKRKRYTKQRFLDFDNS